ncbi:MAG: phosphohistidine phosphatase SixA [Candidatus Eremiobacteraeota bacterium]|nr:phosphohistidine phosphatase SixA [Candidatus Eremiobacteraeota bacterium]
MKCYFLRHGIADREEWSGPDFERPLTAEGREKMAREAKAIEALDLELDLIVTSPLTRAKQTAQIVADRLNARDRLIVDERVGLDFDATDVAKIVREHTDAEAIMFVGHEPSFSATVSRLIGGGRVDFKKGALACVEVPNRIGLAGALLWLLPPKVLAPRR